MLNSEVFKAVHNTYHPVLEEFGPELLQLRLISAPALHACPSRSAKSRVADQARLLADRRPADDVASLVNGGPFLHSLPMWCQVRWSGSGLLHLPSLVRKRLEHIFLETGVTGGPKSRNLHQTALHLEHER